MKKVKDYYYELAKEKNYSARSVFKLQEIDNKYHLIKKGMSVLDLGASPGSWTEYTLNKLCSTGKVISVDLKPLVKSSPNVYFVQEDVYKLSPSSFPDPNMKFDLILSDIAPSTSGNKALNHQISLDLCREVMKLSKQFLKPKGNMVCKVFQGEDFQEFISEEVKLAFKSYKLVKPKSSRKESVELFILGFGYITHKA